MLVYHPFTMNTTLVSVIVFGYFISVSAVGVPAYKSIGHYRHDDIATDIPLDRVMEMVTHVSYEGATVYEDGRIMMTNPSYVFNAEGPTLKGSLAKLFSLKTKYRNVKTLLRVGGGNFSPVLQDETKMVVFATITASHIRQYGFDVGIEIDWADITPEQGNKYVEFLRLTKEILLGTLGSYECWISLFVSARPEIYKQLPLEEMDKYIDIWNLASYNYILPQWGPDATNHSVHASNYQQLSNNIHATPFNTREAIGYYAYEKKIDPSKIHISIPLFATQFHDTNGLGQECGTIDYTKLDSLQSSVLEVVSRDKNAVAAYNYNETSRILTSFECNYTVGFKADQVKNGGLGGITWVQAADQKDGTLIRHAVYESWGGGLQQSNNNLNYSESSFVNIRQGGKQT